jgi:hypothetical protein
VPAPRTCDVTRRGVLCCGVVWCGVVWLIKMGRTRTRVDMDRLDGERTTTTTTTTKKGGQCVYPLLNRAAIEGFPWPPFPKQDVRASHITISPTTHKTPPPQKKHSTDQRLHTKTPTTQHDTTTTALGRTRRKPGRALLEQGAHVAAPRLLPCGWGGRDGVGRGRW